MSIPVLIQVYDEARRLAIAGSTVAPGDFRLKKLIAPLEKSGEKAPVFAKVASAAQAVVESNEKTAAMALLDLATLVNAILYTQGETGRAGEFKPLETVDLGGQATQASARVLKPLLEALTTTGSGRLEIIRDAHERGAFKDLRLVKPALAALDDPYPEIGELVAQKILPLYGKAIVPELRAKLDLKAKSGHLHRLALLHRLDPEGSRDLVQAALEGGSKEMKVAAIECLGSTDADLSYLLEQAKAKAKDVRAAALAALIKGGSTAPEVLAAVTKAIGGADVELILPQVRDATTPAIQTYVLEQATAHLPELLKTRDAKKQSPAIQRMQQLLHGLSRRTDAAAEAFILSLFDHATALAKIKSTPSGSDLNEQVADVMAFGTRAMQKRLVSEHRGLSEARLGSALHAARATMSPADFWAEFHKDLRPSSGKRGRKTSPEQERSALLQDVLTDSDDRGHHMWSWHWRLGYHGRYFDWNQPETATETKLPPIDDRWLDSAIAADCRDLVQELARAGHAASLKYVSDQLKAHQASKSKDDHEEHTLLETMVRIRHPEAGDALIAALKRHTKSTYFYSYWYSRLIPDLPKSELPKFEELLPTLPDKMVDQLMESVLALKNKPE